MGYLDAFISCMLVAPHTPTYSVCVCVGEEGGLGGGSIQGFKTYIAKIYVLQHWDFCNFTFSCWSVLPKLLPRSWMYSF